MGQWSGISDFFAMGGYAQYVGAPTEWFSFVLFAKCSGWCAEDRKRQKSC